MKQPKTLEQIMGENNKKIKPSNKNNKNNSTKLTDREKHFIKNTPNKKVFMNNVKVFAKNSAEYNKLVSYAYSQPALSKSDKVSTSHASNSDDSSTPSKKKYMSKFMHMSPSEMKQALNAYHNTLKLAEQKASTSVESKSKVQSIVDDMMNNRHFLWNSQIQLTTLAKIDALKDILPSDFSGGRSDVIEYVLSSSQTLPDIAHEYPEFYSRFNYYIKKNQPRAVSQYDSVHSHNKIIEADKGLAYSKRRPNDKRRNSKELEDKITHICEVYADEKTKQLKEQFRESYTKEHSASNNTALEHEEVSNSPKGIHTK